MSILSIEKRVRKIEQKLCPPDAGAFTLEELCRTMWDSDKRQFIEVARGTGLSVVISRFELEDAQRDLARRPRYFRGR